MLSERRNDAVVVWAPAKVNLFLEVLAKRPDGYHEIATLMVAVGLYDTLEFRDQSGPDIQLSCDLPDLAVGPENLVDRAARLLQQETGCRRGARVRLTKRIPLAAGLAGGSTDAAAALLGLNLLWRLGLDYKELALLGGMIGSDVAFFFASPAAWCTGRGEIVEPLTLQQPLFFVLVCPSIGLSTAEVYRSIRPPEQPLSGLEIREAAANGNLEELGRRLHNRLQPAAEQMRPEIALVRAQLEALHPAGQLMSGSGSSLFALCRDSGEALRIARSLRAGSEKGVTPRVFLVRSCY